jgi:TrmH family RNA methyltransferase
MNDTVITSRANPLIKDLRALDKKQVREQRGEFLVEGIQPVLAAIQNGALIRMLVVADELLNSKLAREAVRQQERAGTRIVRVSRLVLEALTEREHPTGIAAVVQMPRISLQDVMPQSNSMLVALHEVSNPGNLGTILRTADAVGAHAVVLIGNVTDPHAPAVVTASRGAIFSVPLVRVPSLDVVMKWASAAGVALIAASDKADKVYWDADLCRAVMFLLGNEGEGLPPMVLATSESVRIPMRGKLDSLNLAVAAGVLLYEAARQRAADSPV